MERLTGRINESQARDLDANHHRDSGNVFKNTSGNFDMINYFSLDLADKHVKHKFGFPIKNTNDRSVMEDYKDYADELFIDTK